MSSAATWKKGRVWSRFAGEIFQDWPTLRKSLGGVDCGNGTFTELIVATRRLKSGASILRMGNWPKPGRYRDGRANARRVLRENGA
jgi:hypothetical protein